VQDQAFTAESTLKRLIEAEGEARKILQAAEESARKILDDAQGQAKQRIETTRQEMESVRQARMRNLEAEGGMEMRKRLDQVNREAQEMQRAAKEHAPDAVERVLSWITSGGG
jgi:vacuolar-type H+-ATPase subunit H